MDNTKTDDYFLGKIKEDLIFIVENMRNVSKKDWSQIDCYWIL